MYSQSIGYVLNIFCASRGCKNLYPWHYISSTVQRPYSYTQVQVYLPQTILRHKHTYLENLENLLLCFRYQYGLGSNVNDIRGILDGLFVWLQQTNRAD